MKARQKYSKAFKLEALRRLQQGDKSATELAFELGLRRIVVPVAATTSESRARYFLGHLVSANSCCHCLCFPLPALHNGALVWMLIVMGETMKLCRHFF